MANEYKGYRNTINEFVDWDSGYSEIDNNTLIDKANGEYISGYAIRQLIQNKLRKPIHLESDPKAGLYRVFSSKEAYNAWLNNPDDFGPGTPGDLELFNFVRPTDYQVIVDGIQTGTRYMIENTTNTNVTTLAFHWSVKNERGYKEDESVNAEIKIMCNGTQTFYRNVEWDPSQRDQNMDFAEYLQLGLNTVSIGFSGLTTGAAGSLIIYIYVIRLNITSDFDYTCTSNNGIQCDKDATIAFNVNITRNNIENPGKLYVYVDGVERYRDDIALTETSSKRVRITDTSAYHASTTPIASNNDDGRRFHTLQAWVETEFDNGMKFKSNILYYTFETVSEETGLRNFFINPEISFPSTSFIPPILHNNMFITAYQYMPTTLNWAFYTDNRGGTEESIQVDWKLYENNNGEIIKHHLQSIKATKGSYPEPLTFIPTIYSKELQYDVETSTIHLVAEYQPKNMALETILSIPIYIVKSAESIEENTEYDYKLSAYGKTNNSDDKDIWNAKVSSHYSQQEIDDMTIDFHNISFDVNSGWYNNSFRTSGEDSYCEINYDAFGINGVGNGIAIEVEFESERVYDNTDVIMSIGVQRGENQSEQDYHTNCARIEITPNKATLYNKFNEMVVFTNYKSNEHVKIAFILNPQSNSYNSNLAYIVTNGILERAADITDATGKRFTTNGIGKIVIGKAKSGIRLYNLRVYKTAFTYQDAYNNFIYDSEDKLNIINRNKVKEGVNITLKKCQEAGIDTILITGDITELLTNSAASSDEKAETEVTIERFCPYDASRNFTCSYCRIRKHGQSTLNYPVPSLKFWLNKSLSRPKEGPILSWQGAPILPLGKNRYIMKEGAIPSNKFVLQANYADSSGVHNGTLLRMINDSWYNAKFSGSNNEYKLRTWPQLFSTNEQITLNDGTKLGKNKDGKFWSDVTTEKYGKARKFPYDIRIAPDSFPCVVFYQNTANPSALPKFLGQYVFMDDKHSDFCYGERSIYISDQTDPFCLTAKNKDADINQNKVWDNNGVLRVEVVDLNTVFTSYMSETSLDNEDFEKVVLRKGQYIYRWEKDFELIYPDPDDVEGHVAGDPKPNKPGEYYDKTTTKFAGLPGFPEGESEFRKVTKPFVDWFRWLVSTYNDQQKFQDEAPEHFDLYKMAAYYIIMLRCGLVDSGERNVQIKTYDGQHFHYEPWDMDIALGNKNTGGIAFEPPIDRNTKLGKTYAISGRAANEETGELISSNWLWDALEAWPLFMNNIVPEVAKELYKAGFTYKNLSNMFDNEYSGKWCETIYNESGYYKYIENGGSSHSYLDWMQGARITHRHWWLSTSMDFYDAKWTCGEFKSHFMYVAAYHNTNNNTDDNIFVAPSNSTYMTIVKNEDEITTENADNLDNISFSLAQYCPKGEHTAFPIYNVPINTKAPLYILGANYLEYLDLKTLAPQLDQVKFQGAYSEVNGAPLKELYIGCDTWDDPEEEWPFAISGGGKCNISFPVRIIPEVTTSSGIYDALENLKVIDVRGQLGDLNQARQMSDATLMVGASDQNVGHTQITDVYARGSYLTSFMSAPAGNKFNTLELPAINYDQNGAEISSLNSITFNNTSWDPERLSFWNARYDATNNLLSYERVNVDGDYNYYVPTCIQRVEFRGSTANTPAAKDFVFNWINGIIAEIRMLYNGESEESINARIDRALAGKELILKDLNWNINTCGVPEEFVDGETGEITVVKHYSLTYDDLLLLSKLNIGTENPNVKANQNGATYQGYVMVTGESMTSNQLTKLKSLFGDGIFELTSSGLIIDQSTDDVTINLGGDAYLGPGYYPGEEEFFLNEVPVDDDGNKKHPNKFYGEAILSATKFKLSGNLERPSWLIYPESGGEGSKIHPTGACEIYDSQFDGKTYLLAHESNQGNYRIRLGVSVQEIDPETGQTVRRDKYIFVNIIGATYPQTLQIALNDGSEAGYPSSCADIHKTSNACILPKAGAYAEFYVKTDANDKYTATIDNVYWELTNLSTNAKIITGTGNDPGESYIAYTLRDNTAISINDDYLKKVYNAQRLYGMKLISHAIPTGNDELNIINYRLTAYVKFKSNFVPVENGSQQKYYTLNYDVVIMNDSKIILTYGSKLYTLLDDHYKNVHDGQSLPQEVYRYHLLDIGDFIDLSADIEYQGEITKISTLIANGTRQSILNYLPNVKVVNILNLNINMYDDSALAPNNSADDKKQFVFDKMENLEVLTIAYCEGISNTTSLTINGVTGTYSSRDIDLTNNSKLKEVYFWGTDLNAVLANGSQITTLHLGAPTRVILNNLTHLTKETVQCEYPNNIEDIQIINCGNNESFGIFGKIMIVEQQEEEEEQEP